MERLIRPEELPRWVPGDLLLSSAGRGWRGIESRSYRYGCLDVEVPALSDFMIVAYERGSTQVDRRFTGRWRQADCHPGDVSLLTRSQPSHWRWTAPVDVTHIYLSADLVARVAEDMLELPRADVRLNDLLQIQDPIIRSIITAMTSEASQAVTGGALYVEALGIQLVVHLLRHYASVNAAEASARGRFGPALCRRITDHIEARLGQDLTLEELARLANMGVWNFSRHFRATFQASPHGYIIERRLERARVLLGRGRLPIKEIAFLCGFSDQAHLTRMMHAKSGLTPAALRNPPTEA